MTDAIRGGLYTLVFLSIIFLSGLEFCFESLYILWDIFIALSFLANWNIRSLFQGSIDGALFY